jgi:tRNA(Ile)-lysidine synthase
MDILKAARETIKKYAMLSDRDHVLVGLSGGPDSVCLAVILETLRKEFNLTLSAVYVDHGLRPDEVKKELEFCKRFCNAHSIQFYAESIDLSHCADDTGVNLQEAARKLRYAAYEKISMKLMASRIALGHNADDQAETVFMRLLRGSGRKGMTGIPPVRGIIIRPLIDIERNAIEHFLSQDVSQQFMLDTSNNKENYFRNWIRLSLMSEIRKKNPAVVQDICRTAEILREEDDYLEIIVTKTLMRLISRKRENAIELFLTPLRTLEVPVLRRVLRRAVDAVKGLRGIQFVHIEDIMRLIKEGRSGDSLNLPKDVRVIREYSLLIITTEKPLALSACEIHPPCEIELKEADMMLKAFFEEQGSDSDDGRDTVLLDAGNITFPLKVRARTAGDFFYPLGLGKKKKLQDFFVDEKIPREKRDKIPIVVSGNDIVWIAGHRADERFRVSEGTERFLRLELSTINK